MSPVTRKEKTSDVAAREAASGDYAAPILAVGLPPPGMGTLPPVPKYSLPDLTWINEDTTLQKDDKMDGTEIKKQPDIACHPGWSPV